MGRKPWLATDENHQFLGTIWAEATFWKVGPYIIMPDHLHFFAWPGRLDADLDDWVQYWKSVFYEVPRQTGLLVATGVVS